MDWATAAEIAGIAVGVLAFGRLLSGGSWHLSADIASMKTNIIGMQHEQKRQSEMIERQGRVLEALAEVRGDIRVINSRIENNEKRIANNEQDIRDLQHGEGMVLPITKSPFEKP